MIGFWFSIVQMTSGIALFFNVYLRNNELLFLAELSFMSCLNDCQQRSRCLSVNYHTKMHYCVENSNNSLSSGEGFEQQTGYVFVDKDGTWQEVSFLNVYFGADE